MKKNTLLKSMDVLILTAIVIQFVIFLLNYEKEFVITLTAIVQFSFLLVYFIYSIRLRAYFETTINEENVFFSKQFSEIKDGINDVSYRVSEYFDRQRDIDEIRSHFGQSKVYYQKELLTKDGQRVTIELMLVTDKGIFICDFFEAKFILKGDFQKDRVDIQYSKNNSFSIVNPLSPVWPLFSELKSLLEIKEDSMIKRLMIIENQSFVLGMNTLDENQEIAKEDDIPAKMSRLLKQNKVHLSQEEMNQFISRIDEKIIG
ncbi:MAG: hypothetical protein AB7E09_02355 [Candidatus Izemoplasmatales bacterium]|uniref:NERD domain-containing protein n=1 Tax=Hujiaoplasma nucleasis TaxID=2725268 RepID=A0A7L6N182_9MOLU|nr:hypothetical protein [Hujiaoplasma nucleasis]QLY39923.1 hypothetical protein HF295_03230 [Hujiaoplasma nucleasis]